MNYHTFYQDKANLLINKSIVFIRMKNGVFALSFAIMFPFYIVLLTLAIDGSMLLNKKARLADSLNEAVLVITAVNNYNETVSDLQENLKILEQFITFYLPESTYELDDLQVKVKVVDDNNNSDSFTNYVDYRVSAKVAINTILPLSHLGLPGFNHTILISNYNTNSGNARKYESYRPIDMVLVVDFSRSMNEETTLDLDGTSQVKRIDVLKKVVNNVVDNLLKVTGSKIAIVPFDIGVPIISKHKNEFGQYDLECSVLFIPKPSYQINYGFWANKFVDAKRDQFDYINSSVKSNEILYHMDNARYQYYLNMFLPVYPELDNDMNKLVNKPFSFCKFNSNGSISNGHAKYSCEWDGLKSIFTDENLALIKNEYSKVILNLKTMRSSTETLNGLGFISFMNSDSVDIEKTIEGMFDRNNVVNFIQPWAPNMVEYRMFSEMCQSGMAKNLTTPTENVIREKDEYDNGARITVGQSYRQLALAEDIGRISTYLISLTDNKTELAAFNKMIPSGGTDIITGLLRSLPVLAEGENSNKVIVIISDGEDMDGPKLLTDKFFKNDLCNRIKSDIGTNTIPKTNNLEMYFISVNGNNKERLKYWADNCVGSEHAILAENYEDLIKTFESIMQVETGYFINDCDGSVDCKS